MSAEWGRLDYEGFEAPGKGIQQEGSSPKRKWEKLELMSQKGMLVILSRGFLTQEGTVLDV